MNVKTLGVLSFICLFISACSTESNSSDKPKEANKKIVQNDSLKQETEKGKEERKEEKKFPSEYATSVPLMIQEGPGKFAQNKSLTSQERSDFDKTLTDLPKDLTAEQIYVQLLALQAQEYNDVVKKLEDIIPNFSIKERKEVDGQNINASKNKVLNVAVLLDASGSMAGKIDGQTKMDVANKSILNYVEKLPDKANVMLRVYGHRGSNKESDKALSCGSSEVMYPLKPYEKSQFESALSTFKPTGWTPLGSAIQSVKEDFKKYSGEENLNVIYIVSDGEETCDGDPVKAAKELNQSNTHAVVNIIGFDVKNQEQQQLRDTAEAGGGKFTTVNNTDELHKALNDEYEKLYKEWESWKVEQYFSLGTQWSDLFTNIKRARLEIEDVANNEHFDLKNSARLLYEKGVIDKQTSEGVEKLVKERFEKIIKYFREREKELIALISQNEKKAKENIEQTKP
ncbi:VWA domain-containing protein [Bacillus cereus]|uniref:Amino acid dehydrogenase n=1 Tax=Bacillus cereus TaxID=1396 RepID=A0AA44QB28_BACCE|nr:VWA domain-containing protein [Bacillus cereus]PFN04696.1 amino acid dehydrogenase [Bacillus cereus]PFS01568.1 amino acid dehydrogenase [Bacillus cereus]